MGFFSDQSSYLGVDLGTSSVKIVELENFKGRPKLATYGFTEKKLSDWNGGSDLGDIKDVAAVISEVCKKSRVKSKKVVAALSNFSVFTAIVSLPDMPKKDLASAISWEAKKIIPIPLEEIILDWKIIDESDGAIGGGAGQGGAEAAGASGGLAGGLIGGSAGLGAQAGGAAEIGGAVSQPAGQLAGGAAGSAESGQPIEDNFKKIFSRPKKNLRVLLTGASRALVKKYIDIFNAAGLTLMSLETENFALIRSLVGNDRSVIMVIDLGASTSSVAVVEKGVPVLTRTLEAGGLMITRAISTSLNVNLDRAEQFKQDLALGQETADHSLPQIVEKALGPIINEIKYTINLYQEQHGHKVEKIILTGGSALLGNLPNYLSRTLNINVYVGDPWARVIYPLELRPILDRLGARFAVSLGLAMRNIE